jgi:hypothetical protein
MSYSVTVYAQGGIPGHVFYSLADEQHRMRSFALYPRSSRELILRGLVAPVAGEVRTTDLLQPRSAQLMTSRTFDISAANYQKLLAGSQTAALRPPQYDLDNYNCVTFTRQMLGSIGIDFTSIPLNLPGQVRLDLALLNVEESIRTWRDKLVLAYDRYTSHRSAGEPTAARQVLEQTVAELEVGGETAVPASRMRSQALARR